MKYLLPIMLLLCVACEESESPEASQRSIQTKCFDFGQQDLPFWHETQGDLIFNNDCSASFSDSCETIFAYGDIEITTEKDTDEEFSVEGTMQIDVISGHDWPGCPADGECSFDFTDLRNGGYVLVLYCQGIQRGLVFGNGPEEE